MTYNLPVDPSDLLHHEEDQAGRENELFRRRINLILPGPVGRNYAKTKTGPEPGVVKERFRPVPLCLPVLFPTPHALVISDAIFLRRTRVVRPAFRQVSCQ